MCKTIQEKGLYYKLVILRELKIHYFFILEKFCAINKNNIRNFLLSLSKFMIFLF